MFRGTVLIALALLSVNAQTLNEKGLYSFRLAAEATIGVLFFVTLLALVLAYLLKLHGSPFVTPINFSSLPERELSRIIIRLALLTITMILYLAGFFHSFGTEWVVGYQTMAIAVIGFYSVWAEDRLHVLLFVILSTLNTLCIAGKLPFLGYATNLAELQTGVCIGYFADPTITPTPDIVTNRCVSNGFINYLRLLGLAAILLQGLAAYLGFRYFFLDTSSLQLPNRGEYTQVADGPTFYGSSNSNNSASSATTATTVTPNSPSLVFTSPYQQESGYQSGTASHDDTVM